MAQFQTARPEKFKLMHYPTGYRQLSLRCYICCKKSTNWEPIQGPSNAGIANPCPCLFNAPMWPLDDYRIVEECATIGPEPGFAERGLNETAQWWNPCVT